MGQRLVAARNFRCCSGLHGKLPAPGPSTLDSIEIVSFRAFTPPGAPLDQYALLISTSESGLKQGDGAQLSTSSKVILIN